MGRLIDWLQGQQLHTLVYFQDMEEREERDLSERLLAFSDRVPNFFIRLNNMCISCIAVSPVSK